MAELTLKSRILFRKDSSANWSSKNPILKLAEPGWDSTTNRFKIGNGTSAWSNLDWAAPNPKIYKDNKIVGITDTDSILSWEDGGSVTNINLGKTGFTDILSLFSDSEIQIKVSSSRYYFSQSRFSPSGTSAELGYSSAPWSTIYLSDRIIRPLITTVNSYPNTLSIEVQANNATSSYVGQSSYLNLQVGRNTYSKGSDNKVITFTSGVYETSDSYQPGAFYPSAGGAGIYLGKPAYYFKRAYVESIFTGSTTNVSENIEHSFGIGETNYFGQKTFLVQSYSGNGVTLDSIDGIEVGDLVGYGTTGTSYFGLTVTAIDSSSKSIALSSAPNFSSWSVPVSASNARAYHQGFWIVNKPYAGTTLLLNNSGSYDFDGSYQIILGHNNCGSGFNGLSTEMTPTLMVGNFLINSASPTTYDLGGRIILGKYNAVGTTDIFMIGNGSSNANRSNSFSINPGGGITCGDIKPRTSASFSLGTSSSLWNYVYGSYGIFSTVRPNTNGSGYVGTSSYYYNYGYINYHYVSSLYAKSSSATIGSSSTPFSYAYIDTVYLDNSWATLPSDTNQRALCYKNYYNTSVGNIDAITTPGLYTLRTGITGGPYCSSTGSSGSAATSYFTVLCMATDNGSNYRPMIGIKENDNNLYVKGSTSGNWKRIGWGYGTSAPSGTANTGDIYIQYEA